LPRDPPGAATSSSTEASAGRTVATTSPSPAPAAVRRARPGCRPVPRPSRRSIGLPRYIQRDERGPVPPHVRAASFVPPPIQARPRHLDRSRDRLAGVSDRPDPGHGEERDRPGADEPRHAAALALRRGDRRPRLRLGGAHERPQAHLRQAGPRRRDGPAPGPLLALRAPLLRLLRPSSDRAVDVPRNGRPAGCPLLPRLRTDL